MYIYIIFEFMHVLGVGLSIRRSISCQARHPTASDFLLSASRFALSAISRQARHPTASDFLLSAPRFAASPGAHDFHLRNAVCWWC